MVAPRRRWRPALALAHRLLGLVVSLWLLLLGTTGALLAFKEDWLRLVQPGAAGPPLSGEVLSAPGLARRAAAAEAAFGVERVRSVVLAGPSIALDQVYLRDHAGGGYLDPTTGAVVARWAEGQRIVDVLFDLHHRLLLGEAGKKAVGVVGLLGAALVLSGLVLSWPALRRLRGTMWPRTATRSALLVAHRELGLVAALPLLVLLLTGAAVVFPVTARILLGGAPAPAAPTSKATAPSAAPGIAWEAVFATTLERFPEASPRVVAWPQAPGGPATVRLRQQAEWHPNGRTAVRVTAAGTLLNAHDAVVAPLADRLVYTAYPVHAAKVGGLPYRSLVALAGVALALLSAYGAIGYTRHLLRGGPPPSAQVRASIQAGDQA
jgi:uncharacterized iron-regulated membrane protein